MPFYPERKYARRRTFAIVAYILFMFYLTYSPYESIVTNIISLAIAFGFVSLLCVLSFIVIGVLSYLASFVFDFLYGKDNGKAVRESMGRSGGAVACIIVLVLLLMPVLLIWNNPYRFPFLNNILRFIVNLR